MSAAAARPEPRPPSPDSPDHEDIAEQRLVRAIRELSTVQPTVRPAAYDPIRPGSGLSIARSLELFEAQMASRHLDFAARWLRARGAGYYTIGSAGHEGNAAVAAALRLTDPALLHYRSGAFYLVRAAQSSPRPGWRTRRAARPRRRCRRTDRRRPAQGLRPPRAARDPADLDDRVASAARGRPRLLRRAGGEARTGHAVAARRLVVASFGDASVNHSTAAGALNTAS